jgi:hypothetical protein
MKNPFKPNTNSYQDWDILSDLEWHCTRCELKSSQAKTWQIWKQNGLQLDTDSNGNFYKNIECKKCNKKQIHRKLKSLSILDNTTKRYPINKTLSDRIKNIYKYEEAIFLRKLPASELEIDHKLPQIRWDKDELANTNSMTDTEIKDKFILLNRSNNLLKSRQCEQCKKISIRGTFPGIKYYYKGNELYDNNLNNQEACIGCFWFDPYEWRASLQKIIKN